MIGRDDINLVIIDRVAQCLTILDGLDRRIPFDAVAKQGVIAIMEPQVMNTDLARDLLLGQRQTVVEQRHLLACRQMQQVQPGADLRRQLDRFR